MRRWLLVLMIALLPLRGWAGDAMTLAMWAVSTTAEAPVPCHGAPAAMASRVTESVLHHATAAEAMAHASEADASHPLSHNVCNACDTCNGPALTPTMHAPCATAHTRARTTPDSETFASAVTQRGRKPPIT